MSPLPAIGGPGLAVLFVGINPGLVSEATGHHFAGPSNRFWPVLHLAGFTPRRLRPDEDTILPTFGLGVTNLIARPTRGAGELARHEYEAGAPGLTALVEAWQPRVVAPVGLQVWRWGFRRPRAGVGLQPDTLAGRPVWLLPNPSGINAHYQLPDLVVAYGELRELSTGPG